MRFLIAVIDDRSNSASPNEMTDIDAFNDYLQANGHFLMACGIEDPMNSLVLDNRNDAGELFEGPLHDLKDFMSGFWLVKVESVEQAIELAAWGSKACNRKVELRKLDG
jgi:hypothetical protein